MAFLLPLLPLASASTQDDAGLGGDAPDAPGDAAVLAPGTYAGTLSLDAGDAEDWYAFSSGERILQLSFRATSGRVLGGLYAEDGHVQREGWSGGWDVIIRSDVPGTFLVRFATNASGGGNATYAFTVETLPFHDDAGCRCDAPAPSSGYLPVRSGGAYQGNLSVADGDEADAYVVSLNGPFRLRVDGAGIGVVVRGRELSVPVDTWVPGSLESFHVYAAGPEAGAYAFDIIPDPLPDFRVTSFDVEVTMEDSPLGRMEGRTHVFTMVVENAGEVAGNMTAYVSIHGSVRWTSLAGQTATLAPGASATFRFEWDTTGHAGRYSAVGTAFTWFDQNRADNRAWVGEWVLVRAPVGI